MEMSFTFGGQIHPTELVIEGHIFFFDVYRKLYMKVWNILECLEFNPLDMKCLDGQARCPVKGCKELLTMSNSAGISVTRRYPVS